MEFHSLLRRQLRKAAIDTDLLTPRQKQFLNMIDQAYRQFDSDRKMLERSLDLSSQELLDINSQMRAIFQAFPDVLLVVGRDGLIIDLKGDPEQKELLQMQDLPGRNICDTPLPTLFPGLEASFRHSLDHHRIPPLEGVLQKENSERHFELRMEPLDSLGVILIIRDTSEMKRFQKALAMERERLWVTLESVSEGVITTNTEGRITLINRHAETLSATPAEQALGRTISETLDVALNNGPRFREIVAQVLGGSSVEISRYEPRLIRPDGSSLDIYCSGSPIFDPNFNILGAIFVINDITHRKQIEEEILNMKKIESIGLLAGGIAHDFNNFLTGILGNISLARIYAQKGKDFDEKLKAAEKASIQAQGLTRQFLTFSRGGKPVQKAESIVELIEQSAQFLLRDSGIVFRGAFDDDLWSALIDKGQIAQVLDNLIINAKQAMPRGGTLTVTVRNHPVTPETPSSPLLPGEYLCITVKDQGTGIAREHLNKIFDPYFTTKPQGTGLGLTSSYYIVKRHGGLITVDSKPGEGTSFELVLPATREKADVPGSSEEIPLGKGTIVVMDDNLDVLEVFDQQLTHLGYQVISVENSEELIGLFELAQSKGLEFDLVILDLTIPGDVGGEVSLKKIRDLIPGIRAIVSSGYSNNPVLADYQDYGFNGKICKPFQISTLAMEVRRVMKTCG